MTPTTLATVLAAVLAMMLVAAMSVIVVLLMRHMASVDDSKLTVLVTVVLSTLSGLGAALLLTIKGLFDSH